MGSGKSDYVEVSTGSLQWLLMVMLETWIFASYSKHHVSLIRNQKWFNEDATDVHQPITVIQNEMTLLYSKKIKPKRTKIYQFSYFPSLW